MFSIHFYNNNKLIGYSFVEIHLEPSGGHYNEDDLYTNGLIRIAYARGNHNLLNPYGYEIGGKILNAGVVFMPVGTPRDPWVYV